MKSIMAVYYCLVILAAALSRGSSSSTSIDVDYQISIESTSPTLFGDIRNSGLLDFSKLEIESIDSNENVVTLEVATITLDNKSKSKSSSIDSNSEEDNDTIDTLMSTAGLGSFGTDGKYYTCCTSSAVQVDSCEEDNLGKLIVTLSEEELQQSSTSLSIFSINITTTSEDDAAAAGNGDGGSSGNAIGFGKSPIRRFHKTSQVALIFANCGSDDTIGIRGEVTWMSFQDPASKLPFYIVITAFHIGLCVWYLRLMQQNKESRIQVEEWILGAIALAAAAALFETLSLATSGSMFLKITSMLLALAKHAVCRGLYLILSLGLGVATASLPKLTAALVILFLVTDIFLLWSMHMAFYMNIHIKIPYSGTLVRVMEAIFTIWIPIALCRTMYYLRLHNESVKLSRYRWFFRIYLLTAALSFAERLFMKYDRKDVNWTILREANDIISLLTLACVTILWKPNPSQQMYSYVLLDDDGNAPTTEDKIGGTMNTDLELSEFVIDGDDDDENERSNNNKEEQSQII